MRCAGVAAGGGRGQCSSPRFPGASRATKSALSAAPRLLLAKKPCFRPFAARSRPPDAGPGGRDPPTRQQQAAGWAWEKAPGAELRRRRPGVRPLGLLCDPREATSRPSARGGRGKRTEGQPPALPGHGRRETRERHAGCAAARAHSATATSLVERAGAEGERPGGGHGRRPCHAGVARRAPKGAPLLLVLPQLPSLLFCLIVEAAFGEREQARGAARVTYRGEAGGGAVTRSGRTRNNRGSASFPRRGSFKWCAATALVPGERRDTKGCIFRGQDGLVRGEIELRGTQKSGAGSSLIGHVLK